MDFAFSIVTLAGFAVMPLLSEPYLGVWARYADPVMVSVLAVLLLPVPISILRESLREVLLMAAPHDVLVRRAERVIEESARSGA